MGLISNFNLVSSITWSITGIGLLNIKGLIIRGRLDRIVEVFIPVACSGNSPRLKDPDFRSPRLNMSTFDSISLIEIEDLVKYMDWFKATAFDRLLAGEV